MIRGKIFIVIIAIIVVVAGCEFDAYKENYAELNRPSEDDFLNVQLSTSYPDTLKVFRNTEYSFNLKNAPHSACRVILKLQHRTWQIPSLNGSFMVKVDSFQNGLDTLTMDVYLGTGTGSVADRLGFEVFWFQQKWPVIIDHRPPPKLIPVKGIDASGYLKISWPRCPQENFESYHLDITAGYKTSSVDLYDRNASFYVDSLYVGGTTTYKLSVKVIDYTRGEARSITVTEVTPVAMYENMNFDSLRIYWNKSKYRCRYWLLNSSEQVIYSSANDTSFTVVNPGFGAMVSHFLDVSPDKIKTYNSQSCIRQTSRYTLGENVAGNWPNYGYNSIDKTLYTNTYDGMECYDVYSMQKKRSVLLDMLQYQGFYSSPSNSRKIASLTAKNIYIFPDQSLTNPVIIPYNCFGKTIQHFSLTDNGYITIGSPPGFEVFNVSTKKKVAAAPVDNFPYYSPVKCMATSSDGQYLCSVSHLGMNLFKFDTDTLMRLYSDSRAYTSVLFGNGNDLLYLKLRNSDILEIRNASDFSLVRSVTLFPCVLSGFDPENGLLAVSDLKWVYVLDAVTFVTKLKVRCTTSFINMYAGRLFSYTGYTLKISEYL